MVNIVPESINFPQAEQEVLTFWKQKSVFKTSVEQSSKAKRPRFVFFDGPPFATGLPHYGHLLAGTIKDIVPRWAHMSGYHVERRFGWDCHGLPVEFEIDKMLDIKGPEDVAKMGIKAYNDHCRSIVMKYANEWEIIVGRVGRWVDFKNDYKTLYPNFMESVWWVFKQLYLKGLVYNGVKVMPYSSACSTPLSNFESGQNYKDVIDPAVVVAFPLVDEPDVSLLAWTTTPWTLPSNLLCCANPSLIYVKLREKKTGKLYILMEARLDTLYKKPADEIDILERFEGKQLEGRHYVPLFDYFTDYASSVGGFVVAVDDYVTADSGTGIVHCAPFFGEDDHRVALKIGLVKKDGKIICPIDRSCRFVEPVKDFLGLYVKDADKEIVKHLKKNGRLVKESTIKHSYPYCWRSDTPLIYRAVPSWFVRVQQFSERLVASNDGTYWVPDFIKTKRFGNWLKEARDWAISRNRYWGTPIPLWMSDDGQEIVVVGSIEELEKLSGIKVNDLHRETVDPIEIPSRRLGMPPLKRVTEVFDCWFESGSMPYAQSHYPFENRDIFEANFPANFIAEGVDQTRGWFYTLLVLSTLLFGKPPFQNLIANGLVLASDGQKMSKRKKNYPDPLEVVNKYGADALRLYLINSPVVRAENLRFREEGVRDLLKDVFLPWYNAYRFLVQNIRFYEQNNEGVNFVFKRGEPIISYNIMDRWILSFTQSLFRFVKAEMKAYRLYTVVPRLVKFVDNLTNWYVRMNRKRLKGENTTPVDTRNALDTLFYVLLSMIEMMAPFTPFITEHMYQNLQKVMIIQDEDKPKLKKQTEDYAKRTKPAPLDAKYESVHYLLHRPIDEALIDERVERQVSYMQTVIEMGRVLRDRRNLPLKYPLPEVVVITSSEETVDDVRSLEQFILDELNIKRLTTSTDKRAYGVHLQAEPDVKALGLRLRNESKKIIAAIRALTDEQLEKYREAPDNFQVEGQKLEPGELNIKYTLAASGLTDNLAQKFEADSADGVLVLLNVQADDSLKDEGIAREIINRVQKLRKEAKLLPSDPIHVYYRLKDAEDMKRVCNNMKSYIENALKTPFTDLAPIRWCKQPEFLIHADYNIKGEFIHLAIMTSGGAAQKTSSVATIIVKYQNIENNEKRATCLIENPCKSDIPSQLPQNWKLASDQAKPFAKFVNVKSVHVENANTKREVRSEASVLLEGLDRSTDALKTIDNWSQLKMNIHVALAHKGRQIKWLFDDEHLNNKIEVEDNFQIDSLAGRTLFVKY